MDIFWIEFQQSLKKTLVEMIVNDLSGLFDLVNLQIKDVSNKIGITPANFSPTIFSMIKNVSETVILPIAGIIITYIACHELIHMVIEHNNLANIDTWIIFKWIFKTSIVVYLLSNTFTITMAVFDVAQHVINNAGGILTSNPEVDATALSNMRATLETLDFHVLVGMHLQITIIKYGIHFISISIFIMVYGRMVSIYLRVSLAPIPFSTFGSKEQSQIGQNYLRSLFAVGFQGFLIMICIGIYATFIRSITFSTDIIKDLWFIMGYMLLLATSIFKSSTITNSVFNVH